MLNVNVKLKMANKIPSQEMEHRVIAQQGLDYVSAQPFNRLVHMLRDYVEVPKKHRIGRVRLLFVLENSKDKPYPLT